MLHILLMIIKILFILLAAILLLALSVLALISFVPVRYDLSVQKKENLYAKGKVTWLFHLITVLVEYSEKNTHFCIKLAGWPIVGGKSKEKRKSDFDSSEAETDFPETEYSQEVLPKPEAEERPKETVNYEKSDLLEKETHDSPTPRKIDQPKTNVAAKIRGIWKIFIDFFKRLADSLKNFSETVQSFKSKLDYYKRLWYDKYTRASLQHLKHEAGYLLRHFRPQKVNGRIRFGFDDPAATGWMAGLLCILQSFSGNNLIAEADFDEKIFEGDFNLKGHIRLCHIWKAALSLVLDKHCRITFKRVSKLLQGGN